MTEQGITGTCEQGHTQRILLSGYPKEQAELLAGLMDGTSPVYKSKPRDNPFPESPLARCGICGAWITCTLFGYS